MNKERNPGYYRVKYKGKWLIDKYHAILGFQMFWDSGGMEMEDEFDEIIETPISPEPPETMTREELIEKAKAFEFDRAYFIADSKQALGLDYDELGKFAADFALSLLHQNKLPNGFLPMDV